MTTWNATTSMARGRDALPLHPIPKTKPGRLHKSLDTPRLRRKSHLLQLQKQLQQLQQSYNVHMQQFAVVTNTYLKLALLAMALVSAGLIYANVRCSPGLEDKSL
jgi:hypothetical protein